MSFNSGESISGGDSTSLLEESKDKVSRTDLDADEIVGQLDIDSIFQKVKMPNLMLTKLKVKRSKQAIQDAFSMLNTNMITIDHNLKDLLYLVQDMAQVLYICFDRRVNDISQTQTKMQDRIGGMATRITNESAKQKKGTAEAVEKLESNIMNQV